MCSYSRLSTIDEDTNILCYNGCIKPIKNIEIGDYVCGINSSYRKILTKETVYVDTSVIAPIKGNSFICSNDQKIHLLGTNAFKNKTQSIKVNEFVKKNKHMSAIDKNWKLQRCGFDFDGNNSLPYDPYFIGIWIGDGTKNEAAITSADKEIIDYCCNFATLNKLECVFKKSKSNAYTIRIRTASLYNIDSVNKPHLLKRFLKKYCVINNVKNIANEYLLSSKDNRYKLLAGIIDTDGGVSNGSSVTIASSVKSLAEQYVFLARSLGFAAFLSQKQCSIKNIGFKSIYWSANISGDLVDVPTLIPRKKFLPRKQVKNVLCTGFSIAPNGYKKCVKFSIDGDGKFLLSDFTIVG